MGHMHPGKMQLRNALRLLSLSDTQFSLSKMVAGVQVQILHNQHIPNMENLQLVIGMEKVPAVLMLCTKSREVYFVYSKHFL